MPETSYWSESSYCPGCYWSEPYYYSFHAFFVLEAFGCDFQEHQKPNDEAYYWSEPYDYSWHIEFVHEAFDYNIKEHQKLDAAYCWSVIDGYREDYEYFNS